MLPVSLYTPLYHHVMLLVIIACALLYWSKGGHPGEFHHFNLAATILIGLGMAVFMGFRPISGIYFVDMGAYATEYERVQQGNEARASDVLFNVLQRLCAPVLSANCFFFVCALIYIVPLALASWRIHGAWAFPVFLAFLTAFSFWAYGTNGIRNGMALSILILAFAFDDKPVVMFALMATAFGFHGSTLLPAGAFLIVRYFKRTEIWFGFWLACVVLTVITGNFGQMLLSRFNPFAGETRLDRYIGGSEGGFRADFIAYSIIPVIATLLLAMPTRARTKRLVARVTGRPALNRMTNRIASSPKGMGMGRFASLQSAGPGGSVAYAGIAHIGPDSRVGFARKGQASGVRVASSQRVGGKKDYWSRLPWVQLLRMDPFYARLVNTYLLANAVWILVIHAECSNRFSYLSWFMMPWVLLYPFVPGRYNSRPRTGLIAATLFAQFLFTYIMGAIIYPLRGM
jgi:hypothetical protein